MKILSEEFYDLIRFAECSGECESCCMLNDDGCAVYKLYKQLEEIMNRGLLE